MLNILLQLMMGHACNAPVGPLKLADYRFATMTKKPSKERHP